MGKIECGERSPMKLNAAAAPITRIKWNESNSNLKINLLCNFEIELTIINPTEIIPFHVDELGRNSPAIQLN